MQIDAADKLMEFHQRYSNKDIVEAALTHKVHEFVTKAFHSLTAVFGDSLKSCVLPNPCIEHQGCFAECANYNVNDFAIKLNQTESVPYSLEIKITRNKDVFTIGCNPYDDPYVFSYSSNPIVGKNLNARIELHKNKPVSWKSSDSILLKEADGSVSQKGHESESACNKRSVLKCQAALLDDFKSALEDFKKDAMANNEPDASQTKKAAQPTSFGMGAVLAGIGLIGGGVGLLYAKHKSQKQKPPSQPSKPRSESI